MMLRFSNVSMRFGGIRVLEGVGFEMPEGSIFGLIGPNGAGKTTTFNMITGLFPPTSGDILFCGTSVVGMPMHRITGMGIARTFQNIRVFKEMTLLENVIVGMHKHFQYGITDALLHRSNFRNAEKSARERAMELLSWVRLHKKADMLADSLSYGEQRRLELARALATEPKLLLLDEPVAGMNSSEKNELMAEILNIRKRGYSVLMIEHDMRFVMGLCDYVAVLNFGKLIAAGTPDVVRNDPQVIEAYLGQEDE